ncbi:helix-turn-helix transcriptional regulator [Clostridium butyricum]|uniref:helix-turn-helix transcriptional regulator n=1 Tax=Clostridium butyricum TaxID=1492 RepID=UPI002102FACA|nr:helix-turn-helix transcriptional regulator [Clostridium butyricum]MCQ2014681.1 helix-turn-helix transcriptional regulator [Clostridium butyricum]MCQ2026552.1 helix-turn-helix transcriptional regulator [Clostridium butyricum]
MKVSLKAARVNANLTRKEVVKHLGFSIDTLKAIENGKRDVRVVELDKLCDLYNCTMDDIFLSSKLANSEKSAGGK